MKIRLDFVTNSSSSSFICKMCGETINGWDWEEDYERGICDYCWSEVKTNASKGKEIISFIQYLCNEIYLDEKRVIQIYNNWKGAFSNED